MAGGNKATLAIILTIVVMVAFNVYGFICSNYVQNNMNRLFNFGYYDMFSGPSDVFGPEPYYWEGDPWGGDAPWNGDDFWNDIPGLEGEAEEQMTEEEIEALDLVRESVLDGFPDFTIEEVLQSRVEEYSLEWSCFSDDGEDRPSFYVYATGNVIGDFVMIYAGFDVYDDGRIELFNLDDGSRDEYYEDALALYSEWYEAMMKGIDNTAA